MNENELKSLENRLHSWRPRRPSATLKWRLFLARAANVPRLVRVAGWLTPATACALLTLLLNSENAAPAYGQRRSFDPAIMSNQEYAVFATSRQSAQNNLSFYTFDWTNGSGSGSTLRFTPFRKQMN